ncbi:MAG: ABC transporter substrate-binding protein [Chloroflexi bacterium]|nr:MAG: ABC transporter substrate-binding protein [Chloroflexota bacterium]
MNRRGLLRAAAGLWAATAGVSVIGGCAPGASRVAALRRIGYLSGNTQQSADKGSGPFRERLRELGHMEDRDISIVFKIADNVNERLAGYAAELVGMPVDVLLAVATSAQLAAKKATSTIPIVLVLSADPVGQGLVANLAHPGGNITGLVTGSLSVTGKQVELLKETVPGLARLAVIGNATNTTMTSLLPAVEDAARVMGMTVQAFPVSSPDELDSALDRIAAQRLDALLVLPALSLVRADDQIPAFANKVGLPQIYADIEFARAGGLLHYGANFAAQHRRAADYVDKILKGARPADLPIEQPTEFDLIVNPAAAKKLRLTIPDSVMRRATEFVP